jgi:2-oxoglutarate ferredoxin oxidoreductase subunit beta
LIHDEKDPNPSMQMMLARMRHPEMPEPIGVLRAVSGVSTYDAQINQQVELAKSKWGVGDLQELINSGDTWVVS